ncbi:hypothetical protein [Streptomyces antibioticus]|uniref:hypothetical protein n=1 Tax=Streptomyces antibioticus TaxID=1890 RepID=UPI003F48105A
MSAVSRDGRAVVEAVNRVLAEVRRIADTLTTGVVEDVRAGDDAATAACPTPLTHNWGCGCPTDQVPTGGPCAQHPQAPTFDGVCGGCTQYPADMHPVSVADEDGLRFHRRESLLVLLTRLQRGRSLSEAEADTLRQHVETEIREANTARAVAAGNKRHVQAIVPEINRLATELEQAQAVITRVREVAQWISRHYPGLSQIQLRLAAAVDGTEQPVTEESDTP